MGAQDDIIRFPKALLRNKAKVTLHKPTRPRDAAD
jgi:hypothetical protein